jgi:hypothetical protein
MRIGEGMVWMLNRCWVLALRVGCWVLAVLDAGLGMDKMEASVGVEGVIGGQSTTRTTRRAT